MIKLTYLHKGKKSNEMAALHALEAENKVLRRKIAELSLQIEQLRSRR